MADCIGTLSSDSESGLNEEASLIDRELVIAPATEPVLALEQLLAQVTEHNLHDEVDTGPAVGNERW
jgi:antitoxin component of MazEF toxin-antitoxin module